MCIIWLRVFTHNRRSWGQLKNSTVYIHICTHTSNLFHIYFLLGFFIKYMCFSHPNNRVENTSPFTTWLKVHLLKAIFSVLISLWSGDTKTQRSGVTQGASSPFSPFKPGCLDKWIKVQDRRRPGGWMAWPLTPAFFMERWGHQCWSRSYAGAVCVCV